MERIDRTIAVSQITANPHNARTHSKKQITAIADSIVAFGFLNPVIVDDQGVLIAGHGRIAAAKLLEMASVPAIELRGLSPARRRALMLADNKLAERARWDREALAAEFKELEIVLVEEHLDLSLTGFEAAEIDSISIDFSDGRDPLDVVSPPDGGPPVTRNMDLWLLDHHRLLCGDVRDQETLARLMEGRSATMAFLDPPYNVKVADIVGRGQIKHAEFAMASGEMDRTQFAGFLTTSLGAVAGTLCEGALAYVCMDWKHIGELLAAGEAAFQELVNICVWAKSNAGQGSFYRSQHEFVAVFQRGAAGHVNNIELGRHGRSRSNVWEYPGVNTFRQGRLDDLSVHPTVKPVALVADAIKDATRRRDIVLDTFCGAGTTLLAAERVGRCGYGLEIEPRYVDVSIRRWQNLTGKDAVNAATGATFDEQAAGSEIAVPAEEHGQ